MTKKRQKAPKRRQQPHRVPARTRTTKPRSQDLPGMEDRAIKPLEDVAAAYAEVRDKRMELNKEESELKQHALKLMKKYDKTIYKRDGIEIRIVPGEDEVKVKIHKAGEEGEVSESQAPMLDPADGLSLRDVSADREQTG